MSCRHRSLEPHVHDGYNGWAYRRCTRCRTVVPWGPATTTPQVDAELLAAQAAAHHALVEGNGDGFHAALYATLGPTCGYADFLGGFEDREWIGEYPVDETDEYYQAGALCRQIIEHEEEP